MWGLALMAVGTSGGSRRSAARAAERAGRFAGWLRGWQPLSTAWPRNSVAASLAAAPLDRGFMTIAAATFLPLRCRGSFPRASGDYLFFPSPEVKPTL
jgi:hypothetical protein